ncbi:hypothetical protein VYH29_000365 [Vibrio fluvialis]|nr:hypothetical protein [Vibrio fluvialis]
MKNNIPTRISVDRLVLERPLTQSDFSVDIPAHLRENTSPQEAKDFLDAVLEIINDYEGIEEGAGVNAEKNAEVENA